MIGHRIAVVGPAKGAEQALEATLERLLSDDTLSHVIYLGDDDVIGEVLAGRKQTALSRDEFLQRGLELACQGSAPEIETLLAEHYATRRLSTVRRLPGAPALAIEMLEKWILLLVHDKGELEEDDIANAHVIVFGRSSKPRFRRFGPRCFFSPGPLAGGYIGRLELGESGDLSIHLLDLEGRVVQTEQLEGGGTRFSVTA